MNDKKNDKTIVIEGVTETGQVFRPSDWAERMSGKLSTFQNRRISYSPMLRPSMKDGHKCVLLDPKLKESNPNLYNSILEFAQKNKLKICNQDDNDNSDSDKDS